MTPIKSHNLNLFSLISLGIGSIVGAGIFALLGQVILMAGSATYYSFIVSGLIAMLCGYSYAKLSAVYPDSGGLTDYFKHAFPQKWISGGLSLLYVITSAISICMLAKSFGIYMEHLLSFHANVWAVAIIVILAAINMAGAGDVGKTETIIVVAKVGILLALIFAAFYQFTPPSATREIIPTTKSFLGSIGITFFAYAGFGVLTNAGKDIAHPTKTVPISIYATLLIVMALYISLAFVVMNFIPEKELYHNIDTAMTIAAKNLLGSWGYGLIYLAAILAFISGINATFFSIYRIAQSLGTQRVLPHIYTKPFWRKGSWGNLLSTALIIIATVAFDFSSIVNLASGAYLVSYLGIFVANWVLREKTKPSAILVVGGFVLMVAVFIGFVASLL